MSKELEDNVIDFDLSDLSGSGGTSTDVMDPPKVLERANTKDVGEKGGSSAGKDDPWSALDTLSNPHLDPKGGAKADDGDDDEDEGDQGGSKEKDADDGSDEVDDSELSDEELMEASEKDLDKSQKQQRRKLLREKLKEEQDRVRELERRLEERTQATSEDAQKQLQEREARIQEMEQKLQETQQKSLAPVMVGDYNPADDQELQTINQEAMARMRRASVRLGKHAQVFQENALKWAGRLNAAADDPAKLAELDDQIASQFGDRAGVVMGALGDLVDASQKLSEVKERNAQGYAQRRLEQWEKVRKTSLDRLSQIGNADEATMSTDPLGLNTLITKMAKKNEKFAEMVKRVRDESVQIESGIRPVDLQSPEWAPYVENGQLNQEGISRLEDQVGRHRENVMQVPQRYAQYKLAAMMLPSVLKRLEALEGRVKDRKETDPDPDIETHEKPRGGGQGGPKIGSLDDLPDDPRAVRNPYV